VKEIVKKRKRLRIDAASLGELLRTYAGGEVISSSKGYSICCPFHNDSDPSCTVFYESGVFSCFSCGAIKSLREGLEKLKVPDSVLSKFETDKDEKEKLDLKPLSIESSLDAPKEKIPGNLAIDVLTKEPWIADWGYRAIRAENLSSSVSYIGRVLEPSLVRLSLLVRGKTHQERFSRLGLKVGEHWVYLRLSTEQKFRVYNSQGLNQKNPKQPIFGLQDFKLPKKQAGIILVEGPYDLMRTIQNLEDLKLKEHFTVMSLLGVSHWSSFLSKLELRFLPQLGDTPLIFAFDNDKAGKSLTASALTDCRHKLLLPRKQLLTLKYGAPDPGDLDAMGLKQALLDLGY